MSADRPGPMAGGVLSPGAVVGGDLVVVGPLNHGGMGAVYLVEQKSTGRHRALKVIHPQIVTDPTVQRRFEQEARVGARIRSEHVVDVLAAGVDDATGLPYLVMELLEGEDLRRYLDVHADLDTATIRALFEQLSHAMAAAHAAGVVHRDLKPENIFLAVPHRAGTSGFTVKVLDFGIAKFIAEASARSTQGGVGSPMWMAPEQTVPGEVGPAADVWALGLIAYSLFVGKNYWRAANDASGTPSQLLREIVLEPLPAASVRAAETGLTSRLPAGFDAWFVRCVARDPASRFANAALAWEAMKPLFGGAAPALEATLASSDPPAAPKLDRGTADATPFSLAPRPMPAQETPVATVQQASPPAPAATSSRAALYIAAGIATAGIAVGLGLARRPSEASVAVAHQQVPPPSVGFTAESAPLPVPPPSVSAAPSASTPATTPMASASSTHLAPAFGTTVVVPHAPSPVASAPLFGDPRSGPDEHIGPVMWKVRDHQVRLLTHLVSNASNIADGVVKKAIEWESWQYLQCYQRSFAGAKDLSEATVVIGFDILDQLPRHGALQSSTSTSKLFDDCVLGTLTGQTINAAGPDGKGHVVYALRFVPVT